MVLFPFVSTSSYLYIYADITRKYGLHTGHPNIIENKSIKDPHLNENMDPAHLDFLDLKFDKRLNHIWLKAKETGFSSMYCAFKAFS